MASCIDLWTADVDTLLKTQLIQLCKDNSLSSHGLKSAQLLSHRSLPPLLSSSLATTNRISPRRSAPAKSMWSPDHLLPCSRARQPRPVKPAWVYWPTSSSWHNRQRSRPLHKCLHTSLSRAPRPPLLQQQPRQPHPHPLPPWGPRCTPARSQQGLHPNSPAIAWSHHSSTAYRPHLQHCHLLAMGLPASLPFPPADGGSFSHPSSTNAHLLSSPSAGAIQRLHPHHTGQVCYGSELWWVYGF